jgi:hypothetical protein
MEKTTKTATPATQEVAMKVSVSTTKFQFAHGNKPRGYGQWCFHLLDDQGRTVADVWHTGLYSEAKKAAVTRAKFAGSQDVELGS